MLVWFAVMAVDGLVQIAAAPRVLAALNPAHAVAVFIASPLRGFIVLGAVSLAITGGEALYADMGHFGRFPIRLAWFGLVLPALVLNYFGQGALILGDKTAIENPFFRMVPGWGLIPLVLLSTAATVIASQAVISGSFSLSRQAIQLGLMPQLDIFQTSAAGARPDLYPACQLAVAGRGAGPGPRIPQFERARRGLWFCRHRNDDPDDGAGRRRHARRLALAVADDRRGAGADHDRRSRAVRLELDEDPERRLVPAWSSGSSCSRS